MLPWRRLAVLVAVLAAALAIAIPATSADAATRPFRPTFISPSAILPPNAQCPLWKGLNIIPIGCVPWSVIWEVQFGQPWRP